VSAGVAVPSEGETAGRSPSESVPNQPLLLIGPSASFQESGVSRWLVTHGWPSAWAEDAERAKWLACIQKISMVLVAGEAGSVGRVVRSMRPITGVPIVVLGDPPALGVVDLVTSGADAVIDPTRGPDETFARVTALVRRLTGNWEPGVRYLVAGELRVDLWSQQCQAEARPLRLSPTEYGLLVFLMAHANQSLSTEVIVRKVWGWPPSDGRNALRIVVNRLRRKLGDDPSRPSYIESVRGTGYRFVGNVSELGDQPRPSLEGADVIPLLESLERLSVGLAGCPSASEASDHLLSALDETGYADAMAVFRVDGDMMRLVGERNTPECWRDHVGQGIPLRHSFASAHSVLTGEPFAFGDVAVAGKRFSSTAQALAPGDYHAGIFLPVLRRSIVWGHLGLVRRARQPFDRTGISYLRAVAATFGLALERIEPY
jgi:two-component system, OmpR family, KDP operon response regulator KdpE